MTIHNLKGVAGNVGGVQVAELAAALEQACSDEKKPAIDTYAEQLLQANKALNARLKEYLQQS